jgi:tetratricopeptide (TPR) repeat protein
MQIQFLIVVLLGLVMAFWLPTPVFVFETFMDAINFNGRGGLPSGKKATKSVRFAMTADEIDALDRAQEIVYQAWETVQVSKRLALAGRALALSPYCADAILMFAEKQPKGSPARIELIELARKAGRAAIGEKDFRGLKGQFWGQLETRPYMRATHWLAATFLAEKKTDKAVLLMTEMLELNPNDNQGIRYLLLDALMAVDNRAAAKNLQKKFSEDYSTNFYWHNALLAFRESGPSEDSVQAVIRAREQNPFVLSYLVGSKRAPKNGIGIYSLGDESEAIVYAEHALDMWQSTNGAINWLIEIENKTKTKLH